MDESSMNAARRAIISDIRHNTSCSGKDAYELSKDPEFMEKWVRVTVRNDRIDGKPKLKEPRGPSFRSRLRLLKQMEAIQERNALKKRSKVVRRGNRIRKLMEKGMDLAQAILKADTPNE